MVDGPEDKCQFCGKNVSKKEVIMAGKENMGNIVEGIGEAVIREMRNPIPPRPKKRKLFLKYFEQNKEAILVDYNSMKLRDFFKRWGISSTGWTKLKVDWNVQGKHKKHSSKKEWESAIPEVPEAVARSVDAPLTEHEHYLVLLGWQQAAREFLRAGQAKHSL